MVGVNVNGGFMIRFIFSLLVFFLMPVAAFAQGSGWVSGSQVRAQLVSGDIDADGFDVGLDVQMGEGWHGYWRVAGDAGLPPRFDWSGSRNVKDVTVEWPAPVRKDEAGLQVFGYGDRVFFPVRVMPEVVGEAVALDLALDIMVCKDICIPQKLHLTMDVPGSVSGNVSGVTAQRLIDFARLKVPHEGDSADLKIENVVVGPEALVFTVYSKGGFEGFDIFSHMADLSYAFTALPEVVVDVGLADSRAMYRLSAPAGVENLVEWLEGQVLSVTLVQGRHAIEKTLEF